MNVFLLFFSSWLWFSPVQVNNSITPAEVADRMCSCGQENQIPLYAKQYTDATTEQEKREAKSDMSVAVRKMHQCMDMPTILQQVRALPTHERSQFEDNVMHKLTETCNDIALAMHSMR